MWSIKWNNQVYIFKLNYATILPFTLYNYNRIRFYLCKYLSVLEQPLANIKTTKYKLRILLLLIILVQNYLKHNIN